MVVVVVKLVAVLVVVVDVGMISAAVVTGSVVKELKVVVSPNVSSLVVTDVLSVVVWGGSVGAVVIFLVAASVGAALLNVEEAVEVEEWDT